MIKTILAGVCALVLVTLLGYQAMAGSDDSSGQAQDRAQIESLMWHYTRALDTLNPDVYAATYTADGQFGSGPNAVKGREALRKMITGLRQRAADAQAKSGKKGPAMCDRGGCPRYEPGPEAEHDALRTVLIQCLHFGASMSYTWPRRLSNARFTPRAEVLQCPPTSSGDPIAPPASSW